MSVKESGQIVPLPAGLQDVRAMLSQNMTGLSALLSGFMEPARFCGAVLTLCRLNPKLTDHTVANRASLLLAVLRIAQLQLSPDPALGQAYIVPRKGVALMQLGYKGYLSLAYRSPLVRAVRYGVVGMKDRFLWRDGRDFALEHEPSEEGWPAKMEEVKCAWAILETTRGGEIPRVMYRAEILRHKSRGEGSQPAWATDPAPMAVKTVLADICRRGPFQEDVARAFALDAAGTAGKAQPRNEDEFIDADFSEPGAEAEPDGVSARFKAAHQLTAPPESVDLPMMDYLHVRQLYEDLAADGLDPNDLRAHLAKEYGSEDTIPTTAREAILAWGRERVKER